MLVNLLYNFYVYILYDSTGRPAPDGIFCEKIFGPIRDWECYCRKNIGILKKISRKNITVICDKCDVQITESKIRNYRMG
jgi:DNA-directed RNA polymerase subunit beta'